MNPEFLDDYNFQKLVLEQTENLFYGTWLRN